MTIPTVTKLVWFAMGIGGAVLVNIISNLLTPGGWSAIKFARRGWSISREIRLKGAINQQEELNAKPILALLPPLLWIGGILIVIGVSILVDLDFGPEQPPPSFIPHNRSFETGFLALLLGFPFAWSIVTATYRISEGEKRLIKLRQRLETAIEKKAEHR